MTKYLKPSISVPLCERFSGKLQASGIALLCSEDPCGGTNIGASCEYDGTYKIFIYPFELGVPCPVSGLSSCTVSALSVNDVPISDPGSICHVFDDSGTYCPEGCGIKIECSAVGMSICSAENDSIEATVSCSGFGDPVECMNPQG